MYKNVQADNLFDIDSLKEGELCNVSILARNIDNDDVDNDYTDKVEKITEEEIIFSNTEDQYSYQTIIHYYDRINNIFYYLERTVSNRWVVFKWTVNEYEELYEEVIDWFNGDGTSTPEHVISIAKDEKVFNFT